MAESPGLQAPGPAGLELALRPGLPAYAELHCLSHFSFLRGASSPAELVQRAKALGYSALALTDECSVAGAVRAHEAALACGMALILGSEMAWGAIKLVVLARDQQGWAGLCQFITAARARAPKGQYLVDEHSPWALLQSGCECIVLPQRQALDAARPEAIAQAVSEVMACLGQPAWLGLELLLAPDDSLWLQSLQQVGQALHMRLVACGDVHMHARSRKPLQDVATAIGLGRTVAECGFALQPNAERHLRSRLRLAALYPRSALAATQEIAAACHFSLAEIRYDYPQESVLPGMDARQTLAWHTWQGAAGRYPLGIAESVRAQLCKELLLIAECGYEMYFLTVHDIVRYARSQGILCQGRGSAANSAVCFCLGITAVDPMHAHLLVERFISRERDDPPDIDVDFEHQRREEVIQYIYAKYGRERAALTAVVTRWRTRSALRDVGKALGIAPALVDALAKEERGAVPAAQTTPASQAGGAQHPAHESSYEGTHEGSYKQVEDLVQAKTERVRLLAEQLGVDLPQRQVLLWLQLAQQLRGSPRHLSQHVGGFVLTQGQLTSLVPVEPAAMAGRTVIQWDKDDLDAVGLLKVDVLALGMLSALQKCLLARAALRGPMWGLADIPAQDKATYDMICRADTVGVFQIESRAQMSMLPRLQPRTFYDLVVEVAIVRPGPLQGGMVHPYLLARERAARQLPLQLEKPELGQALARTLGIPIFQEQVMQIAMVAAGFTPGQADALRRSMAAWKRQGGVHRFERPLIDGMLARGYRPAFAQAIFQQMLGFGEYGFPESHAYSFALLAYASSWFKCHEPACFLAALLNAQPMGFYAPSQLVQDARRHGVRVLPVDVRYSDWDCQLQGPVEPVAGVDLPQPAVRLGLRLVGQLPEAAARRVIHARAERDLASVADLAQRAGLQRSHVQALAAADALQGLSGHRHQQMWQAAAQHEAPPLFAGLGAMADEPALALPAPSEAQDIAQDYAATGLSLRRHPLALLRPHWQRYGLRTAMELGRSAQAVVVRACGIVTVRQRPPTAKGTLFITLEDETGMVNLVIWPQQVQRWREVLLSARLLAVQGLWQYSNPEAAQPEAGQDQGQACRPGHLVVQRCKDMSDWLGRLEGAGVASRDFH